MAKNLIWIWIFLTLCLGTASVRAQPADDTFGQIIQINTNFHSFVGKPSWLLIIRDLDHGQNIPYLFDIRKGENFWVAFTYSRNYLITVSNLRMESYRPYKNTFRLYETKDFCNLESNGRILRGESISIRITGDLSPYHCSYQCNVSRYLDTNFTIVNQNS